MIVIVTRPEPDGSAFAAEVARAGHTAVLSPAMHIEILGSAGDLSEIGALAFTSANGVRAFAASADANAVRVPVFAVGQASAAAACAAGLPSPLVAGGEVESLADLIASTAARAPLAGPVLHVAGSDRAGDLLALLEARAVPARRVVLYRAEPTPALRREAADALRDQPHEVAVALFSPRTARIFAQQVDAAGLLDRLASATALCLSSAVAAAAAECPWSEIRTAADVSASYMISELQRERAPR